ncbi:unnamed protein product, partial [Brenthis ino]
MRFFNTIMTSQGWRVRCEGEEGCVTCEVRTLRRMRDRGTPAAQARPYPLPRISLPPAACPARPVSRRECTPSDDL